MYIIKRKCWHAFFAPVIVDVIIVCSIVICRLAVVRWRQPEKEMSTKSKWQNKLQYIVVFSLFLSLSPPLSLCVSLCVCHNVYMTLTKLIACINTFTMVAVMVCWGVAVTMGVSPLPLRFPFHPLVPPFRLYLTINLIQIEHYSYYQPKTIPCMPQMASIAAIISIVSTKIIRMYTTRTRTHIE